MSEAPARSEQGVLVALVWWAFGALLVPLTLYCALATLFAVPGLGGGWVFSTSHMPWGTWTFMAAATLCLLALDVMAVISGAWFFRGKTRPVVRITQVVAVAGLLAEIGFWSSPRGRSFADPDRVWIAGTLAVWLVGFAFSLLAQRIVARGQA